MRRSPSETSRTSLSEDQPACELCQRESLRFTSHHLIPRSKGGKFGPQVKLCPTCHRQLHAMFSESTLAKELNSIQAIRTNPAFSEYLRWARRQKTTANFRVRKANNRR
ncbi:MAG: HNH endonuclease [Chloroflexota bacterium]|nr:HNH endonuclease [Chloroflexota bacterium]